MTSEGGKNALCCQPRCRNSRDLCQHAHHKDQRRTGEGEQKLGWCKAAVGDSIVQADAANTQPTSERNTCHAQADQNCELMVDVAIDGLECKEQNDLQHHQCEASCSHTTCFTLMVLQIV